MCVCIFKGMSQGACVPVTIAIEKKEKNRDEASILWKVCTLETHICFHSIKLALKGCVGFSPASLLKTRFPGEAALGFGFST